MTLQPTNTDRMLAEEVIAKSGVASQPTNTSDRILAEEVIAKGGVSCPFPWRLHHMLSQVEDEGLTHIVAWMPHGRAFLVKDVKRFAQDVMPRFFGQTKYPSFQRQLNLYGFSRFAHGTDKGAYYNLCFIRGHCKLVHQMVRRKIKGTKVRQTIRACDEPDFYDKAWEGHIEPTYPKELLQATENQSTVVTPPPPSEKSSPKKLKARALSLPGSAIPTTFHKKPTTKEHVMILPRVSVHSDAPLEVSSHTNDDYQYQQPSSLDWAPLDFQTEDGDLIFFEGVPFHFTEHEDPLSSAMSVPSGNIPPTEDDGSYLCRKDSSYANLTAV